MEIMRRNVKREKGKLDTAAVPVVWIHYCHSFNGFLYSLFDKYNCTFFGTLVYHKSRRALF
jgi:hypothetical protein